MNQISKKNGSICKNSEEVVLDFAFSFFVVAGVMITLYHSILIILAENNQELKPLIFVLQFMLRMKI